MEKQNLIIKPFNTKKFNNFFLIFCIFIFSLSTYWLYQKHLIGNDSTISEWLINYQGGFTRRGLIGEICFRLAKEGTKLVIAEMDTESGKKTQKKILL